MDTRHIILYIFVTLHGKISHIDIFFFPKLSYYLVIKIDKISFKMIPINNIDKLITDTRVFKVLRCYKSEK